MRCTDSYWTDRWGTQHGPFDDILGSDDGSIKPKRDYK